MSPPRLVVVDDAAELSRVGADVVIETVAGTRGAAVAAATGNTPMGLYGELARRSRSGLLDTSRITAYQLDEYLDLPSGDRRSLFGWMRRSFLEPLAIPHERVVPLPRAGDLVRACAAFDRTLEASGGLDLAILGLGPNGHLGFNEPPCDPTAGTRAVVLSPVTIEANAGYWDGIAALPTRAVTMGMRQLLSARALLLVVSGGSKHEIVRRAMEGPIGPAVPASFLQRASGTVSVVVDRAAWGDV